MKEEKPYEKCLKFKHFRFLLSDIFDVVRDSKDSVYLLDFAPFDSKWADSLAFNWDELCAFDEDVSKIFCNLIKFVLITCFLTQQPIAVSAEEEDPEFRYLSSDCGIQPSKRNNYGIPKDVLDMFQVPGQSSSSRDTESGGNSIAADRGNSTEDQSDPNTLDDFINNRLEKVSFDCGLSDSFGKFMRISFIAIADLSKSTERQCRIQ